MDLLTRKGHRRVRAHAERRRTISHPPARGGGQCPPAATRPAVTDERALAGLLAPTSGLHGCAAHLNHDEAAWLADALASDVQLCAELAALLEELTDEGRREFISAFVHELPRGRTAASAAMPALRRTVGAACRDAGGRANPGSGD